MRRVEFLGLPGAGKSTLATVARRNLEQAGRRVVGQEDLLQFALRSGAKGWMLRSMLTALPKQPARKLAGSAFVRSPRNLLWLRRFMLDHPAAVGAVIRELGRSEDPGAERVLGWTLQLFAIHALADATFEPKWIAVLDEGFANRAVSIFLNPHAGASRQDLLSYLGSVPLPDLLILADSSVATCERRLASRGWTERLRATQPPDRQAWLERRSELVVEVVAEMRARGVKVEAVPNDGGLELATAHVERALGHLIRRDHPSAALADPAVRSRDPYQPHRKEAT